MQEGNLGLANPYASLMGAKYDRKATPGITEWSRLRAHIDGAVCYISSRNKNIWCKKIQYKRRVLYTGYNRKRNYI